MASTANTTTRRALLGAAVAAPLLALPSAAPAHSAVDTASWDAAKQRYVRATERHQIRDAAYSAAWDRYEAAKPSLDMIDWSTVHFHASRNEHSARTFDIEADWQNFLSLENKAWFSRDPAKTKADYRAALSTFTRWRQLDDAAQEASGLKREDAALTAAVDELGAADTALMQTPAPHGPALLFKLEKLLEIEEDDTTAGWSAAYVAQTLADARRLLNT